jgi:hypothetical protein
MTEIARRIESAKRSAVIYRNYRRARERALTRLSNAYPETYKELLEQEKIVDEQMGKKWLDLDGNTSESMDIDTDTPPSSGREREQASTGTDQGNDGGEA